MSGVPFRVRPAHSEDDFEFVESAWRATFRSNGAGVMGADITHYNEEMLRIFKAILPRATTLLACEDTDDNNLGGFVCFSGDELHYAYVKVDFRKAGLVPLMLEGVKIRRYTFDTQVGFKRLKPNDRGWIYTPRWTLHAA